jgi:hypothetical protein
MVQPPLTGTFPQIALQKNPQPQVFCANHLRSSLAASGAKYVRIPAAPARRKHSRLSSIAASRFNQPAAAADASIAYSPLT